MRGDGNDDSEKTGAQGSNGKTPDNTKPGGANKKYSSQLHTLSLLGICKADRVDAGRVYRSSAA
jgi:hypothetical protein